MADEQTPQSPYFFRRPRREEGERAVLPVAQSQIPGSEIRQTYSEARLSQSESDMRADVTIPTGHTPSCCVEAVNPAVERTTADQTTADPVISAPTSLPLPTAGTLNAPFDMSVLLTFLNNKFDESNAKLNANLNEKLNETNININEKLNETNANLNIKLNETNMKLNETNANLNEKLNETNANLNEKLNETKTEINNCQLAIENQILEIRKDQNDFRQEINEIRAIQANQTDEIAKLNAKLDTKIEESHQEIKSFLTESIFKHQKTIEVETQQRHTEILNTVTQKLDTFSNSVDTRIATITQQTRDEIETYSKNNIQTIQNEIIPKIDLQTKIIESQQADINSINKAIDYCDSEIKSLKSQSKLGNFSNGAIQVICPGNESNDRHLPKFNGRTNNPNEYLQKLERYYEKSIERNQPNDTTEHLRDILENSFEGPASRWLQLIKRDITSWNSFSQEFLSKYWNRDIQRGIKAKIEAEKYRNNGTLSRTEYFTERVLLLQSITPTLTEEEIVATLAERFDTLIQDSINVQRITTIRDFERLLQREDIREGPKRNKNTNQSNYQQHSRPSSPNQINKHNNDRHYDYKAYQPKYNHQNQNKPYNNQAHNNHSNHQNYQHNPNNNYRHNYSHQYRNHNNNKPYNRDQSRPQYEPHYQQNGNRLYPTNEQSQICTMIRENSSPIQPEPSRITSNTGSDISSQQLNPNAL
jgi:hypothetical protein